MVDRSAGVVDTEADAELVVDLNIETHRASVPDQRPLRSWRTPFWDPAAGSLDTRRAMFLRRSQWTVAAGRGFRFSAARSKVMATTGFLTLMRGSGCPRREPARGTALWRRTFERLIISLLHTLPETLGEHFLHVVLRCPSWYLVRRGCSGPCVHFGSSPQLQGHSLGISSPSRIHREQ